LVVVGIADDHGAVQIVKNFATANHGQYPLVMSTRALAASFPGLIGLPTTYVVDQQGTTREETRRPAQDGPGGRGGAGAARRRRPMTDGRVRGGVEPASRRPQDHAAIRRTRPGTLPATPSTIGCRVMGATEAP
jgi:hypothetical protein